MPITKAQKTKIVETLSDAAKSASAFLFADFAGLKTKDMNELRKTLRTLGGKAQVVKKTLAGRGLTDMFSEELRARPGGIAALWFAADDIVPVFNAVWQFAKKHEAFKIVGGYAKEIGVLDAATVTRIAKLPGREVLYGQLVGMLAAPFRGFLWALNFNTRQVVATIGAIKK